MAQNHVVLRGPPRFEMISCVEALLLESKNEEGRAMLGDKALRAGLVERFGEKAMGLVTAGVLSRLKLDARKKLKLLPSRDGTTKGKKLSTRGRMGKAKGAGGSKSKGRRLSRFGAERSNSGRLFVLAPEHSAIIGKTTLYPSTVKDPQQVKNALIDGHNNPKVGRWVLKGEWAGARLFTLTMQERATCSTTCHHWGSCMGNNMHLAQRLRHGTPLEDRLAQDLPTLLERYSQGIVVRLHILGDFYNFAYINKWEGWLKKYPTLRVFGYTHRLPNTYLGAEINRIRWERWHQFAIRFSQDKPVDGWGEAITVPNVETANNLGAIVCPAQLHKTATCGTCTLCWEQPKANIAFLWHGHSKRGVGRTLHAT